MLISNIVIITSLFPGTLGMTSFLTATNYQFTKSLETLFKAQMEVTDDRSMWRYLENEFLDGIYNEIWYNDGDTQ